MGLGLSFHNQYWPAQYLIDQNGMVVYQKFGEGNGEIMEHNILALLNMPNYHLTMPFEKSDNQFDALQTPELYLGYQHSNGYGGNLAIDNDQMNEYAFPQCLT